MKFAVFYKYMSINSVIYTGNIYMVLLRRITQQLNQIDKNSELLIISSLILSNPHLHKRTGN